jgi:formyl-CoA transferase
METVTRTRTTADWVKLLEDKAVPCGPINGIADAFADAQVQHREIWVKQPKDGVEGPQTAPETIATIASPLRLQANPPVLRRAPPAMGQHTDEVLRSLGRSDADIAALRAQGIV